MQLQELDGSAFTDILAHLDGKRIGINTYRMGVGIGRSQCFGMVRKRSMPPDLSRQSWMDPRLHYLLMQFALNHVTVPFTSIQINENYKCAAHKDKHNDGISYIIGFGNYTGGELCLDLSGGVQKFNIRHRPMLFNGAETLHSTDEWVGSRYSLVFHTLVSPSKFPMVARLCYYEACVIGGIWKIKMEIPGQEVRYLFGKNGLDHPLKGRKRKVETALIPTDPSLTPAQNLLANLLQGGTHAPLDPLLAFIGRPEWQWTAP